MSKCNPKDFPLCFSNEQSGVASITQKKKKKKWLEYAQQSSAQLSHLVRINEGENGRDSEKQDYNEAMLIQIPISSVYMLDILNEMGTLEAKAGEVFKG